MFCLKREKKKDQTRANGEKLKQSGSQETKSEAKSVCWVFNRAFLAGLSEGGRRAAVPSHPSPRKWGAGQGKKQGLKGSGAREGLWKRGGNGNLSVSDFSV